MFQQRGGKVLGKGGYGAVTTLKTDKPDKYVAKVFVEKIKNSQLEEEKKVHDKIKEYFNNIKDYTNHIIVYDSVVDTTDYIQNDDLKSLQEELNKTQVLSRDVLILPKGEKQGNQVLRKLPHTKDSNKKLILIENRIKYIQTLFDAINFIHSNRVYHLDLNFDNIILHNRRLKLIDLDTMYMYDWGEYNSKKLVDIIPATYILYHINPCFSGILDYLYPSKREDGSTDWSKHELRGTKFEDESKSQVDIIYEVMKSQMENMYNAIKTDPEHIGFRYLTEMITTIRKIYEYLTSNTISEDTLLNYTNPLLYFLFYYCMDKRFLDAIYRDGDDISDKYTQFKDTIKTFLSWDDHDVFIGAELKVLDVGNEFDPVYGFMKDVVSSKNYYRILQSKDLFSLCFMLLEFLTYLTDKKCWNISEELRSMLFRYYYGMFVDIINMFLKSDFNLEKIISKNKVALDNIILLLEPKENKPTTGPKLIFPQKIISPIRSQRMSPIIGKRKTRKYSLNSKKKYTRKSHLKRTKL
jgi:serine/threonine protein kinase